MALIFKDGFESGNFSAWGGTVDATIVSGTSGMKGTYQGYIGASSGIGGYISTGTFTATSEIYFSLLHQTDFSITQGILWSLKNSGTTHIRCLILDTGAVRIDRGTTNIANSSTGVCATNTTYKMDAYVKIADSGGRVVIKINDTTVIDFTGDTDVNSTGQLNEFRLGEHAGVYCKNKYDNVILDNSTWPTYTDEISASRNAYINGTNLISASIPAFIEGEPVVISLSSLAFIEGFGGTISNNIGAFVYGVGTLSCGITAYIDGVVFSSVDSKIDAFLHGASEVSSSSNTFLHGFDETDIKVDAYIDSYYELSINISGYVYGWDTIAISIPAYVDTSTIIIDGIDAYIDASGTILNSVNATIYGVDGVSYDIGTYIEGKETISAGVWAYIEPKDAPNVNVRGYIYGWDTIDQNSQAYIDTSLIINAGIKAHAHGALIKATSIAAHLHIVDYIDVSSPVFTLGYAEISGGVKAHIHDFDEIVADSISAYIFPIGTSTISVSAAIPDITAEISINTKSYINAVLGVTGVGITGFMYGYDIIGINSKSYVDTSISISSSVNAYMWPWEPGHVHTIPAYLAAVDYTALDYVGFGHFKGVVLTDMLYNRVVTLKSEYYGGTGDIKFNTYVCNGTGYSVYNIMMRTNTDWMNQVKIMRGSIPILLTDEWGTSTTIISVMANDTASYMPIIVTPSIGITGYVEIPIYITYTNII